MYTTYLAYPRSQPPSTISKILPLLLGSWPRQISTKILAMTWAATLSWARISSSTLHRAQELAQSGISEVRALRVTLMRSPLLPKAPPFRPQLDPRILIGSNSNPLVELWLPRFVIVHTSFKDCIVLMCPAIRFTVLIQEEEFPLLRYVLSSTLNVGKVTDRHPVRSWVSAYNGEIHLQILSVSFSHLFCTLWFIERDGTQGCMVEFFLALVMHFTILHPAMEFVVMLASRHFRRKICVTLKERIPTAAFVRKHVTVQS